MSILDPAIHQRLIDEIGEIARTAGIPKHFITESMTSYCSAEEVEWVKSYRDHIGTGVFGMAYVGADHASRMMAMCGAFTRNFVLAQVVPMSDLLEQLRTNDGPRCSVLFVPSFHRQTKQGGMTAYQINLLWNCLEERMLTERQTVIGVHSLTAMKTDYGDHFHQLVQNHYTQVAA